MLMSEKSLTLFQKIVRWYREAPKQTAFLYYEKRQLCKKTYEDIFYQVAAKRYFYKNTGIHRIGLLGTNSWQWICEAWGIMAAGITVAYLDPVLSVDDLAAAVKRTDLEAIVCEKDLISLAVDIQKILPDISVMEYDHSEKTEFTELSQVAKTAEHEWEEGDAIFFTSGTSKNSKAVVTPASSICGQILAHLPLLVHAPGRVLLHPLPFHHSFGFVMLNFFYEAGCPIFISSMKSLLKDVKQIQPYMIVLVPSAAEFLLRKDGLPDSLHSMVISGSYCSKELAAKIRNKGIVVQNQYGSSELPCGIADNLPEDDVDALTLHAYASVEISGEGEVIVTDPYHMREYYNNPEETKEVLIDGKIHTGDLGYLDDEGRLHLIGRKKNMILMENGEKIFCPDVDAQLSALPGVQEAAVIYVEKQLIAVIARKKGEDQVEMDKALAEYNREQPYYRRIQKIWIYGDSLPYTSSGKLNRNRLESEYARMKREDGTANE